MTAAQTARSNFIASPRLPRSLWRKPWWWQQRLYWLTLSPATRHQRRDVFHAVQICYGVRPEPVS